MADEQKKEETDPTTNISIAAATTTTPTTTTINADQNKEDISPKKLTNPRGKGRPAKQEGKSSSTPKSPKAKGKTSSTHSPENSLPKAVVNRIIKSALPEGVQLSKDARDAIAFAGRIWINYLTAASNEFCQLANRSLIQCPDVLAALDELEFGEFNKKLQQALDTTTALKVLKKKKKSELSDPLVKLSSSTVDS